MSNEPLAYPSKAAQFLTRFWPAPVAVDARERWRAFVGAGCGVLITALLSRWWAGPMAAGPWLVAPLGASAVLVFAVPASPLAQPWSVIGGNTLSALVGTVCAMWIGDPAWAGSVAVAVAIALMFSLRCLHPPGGATALFAALGAASFHFALFPMLVNSVLLVLAGVLYNSLTGRRYPHAQGWVAPGAQTAAPPARFTEADLDAALAHYNQVLDVSRDDLQELLHHAESAAYQRNFGSLRCKDIMTREPITARPGTPLREAWREMRQEKIKALPVVDKSRHVVGIVTVADFMRHADLDQHEGIGSRLRALMRRGGSLHAAGKPEVVGQIMTRTVRVASEEKQLAELVPLFSEGGHHHIPVIDAERRLSGIITQTDLVRSLYRAAQPVA
ncbi:HPP family protein [Hydrogenophaga sp. BPS33]|uniref:HPP family protein n=1 Tax=Hydrogenophaga sp. BPS33 TaxID=2651974 RepID=UPI00131F7D20|nr:HPP family protein [Hydrogenophaga sp. BPS33]QHE88299.1 HPP family protein [Hydrogenophaga sp. BPS33]